MQPDLLEESRRWRAQAEQDLAAGEKLAHLGIHYAACFFAQQAAEKALKGLMLEIGRPPDRGHSVVALSRVIVTLQPALATALAPLVFLDQYYIPTRYPDAIPGGIPADAFGPEDSQRALAGARACLSVRPEPGAEPQP